MNLTFLRRALDCCLGSVGNRQLDLSQIINPLCLLFQCSCGARHILIGMLLRLEKEIMERELNQKSDELNRVKRERARSARGVAPEQHRNTRRSGGNDAPRGSPAYFHCNQEHPEAIPQHKYEKHSRDSPGFVFDTHGNRGPKKLSLIHI